MATQNLTELCYHLIDNTLGELSATLFRTLAQHARLTLNSLAQYSQVPLRRLKPCLSILIEQQLVLYYTADDETPTYYHVDWTNTYNLARRTNVVSLVRDRHGDAAAHITDNILQLGHARVGDLAEAYDLAPTFKRDSGVQLDQHHAAEDRTLNGIGSLSASANSSLHNITTASEFHATLRTLLRAGILAKVGPRSHLPLSDLQDELEETVIADLFSDRKVTGPKKQVEFRREVSALKRKWREDDEYSDVRDLSSRGNGKRPDMSAPPTKRAKPNGGLPNGVSNHDADDVGSNAKLSSDLVVRVSYPRVIVALRTQCLERLAQHHLGSATSAVYGALLRSLESKFRTVHQDDEEGAKDHDDDEESTSPTVTVAEIAELLDPAINLASAIKGVSHLVPNGVGKSKTHAQIIDDELELDIKNELIDLEEDTKTNGHSTLRDRSTRLSLIEAHLEVLEEHPKHLCKHVRRNGSNEWRVPFSALTETLIVAELDTIIGARLDKVAARVVRILREHGKLEEKAIASMCMMRIKDVRAVLTQLQLYGFVDVQELPKDAARQPARTLYLWYFDVGRVRGMVLQQTYKAMARTLQRMPVERERYRTAIEKAEREDVKGKEAERLDQASREQLWRWREVEERLLTQEERMDNVVAILRDFSGRDNSLSS